MSEQATMTETESRAETELGENSIPMDDAILVPKEVLSCLLACGAIVQELILRAWDDRENSNAAILQAASAFGLQIEREADEAEIESGEADEGDVMLALSPVFYGAMQGWADGIAEHLSEMSDEDADDEAELPFAPAGGTS